MIYAPLRIHSKTVMVVRTRLEAGTGEECFSVLTYLDGKMFASYFPVLPLDKANDLADAVIHGDREAEEAIVREFQDVRPRKRCDCFNPPKV